MLFFVGNDGRIITYSITSIFNLLKGDYRYGTMVFVNNWSDAMFLFKPKDGKDNQLLIGVGLGIGLGMGFGIFNGELLLSLILGIGAGVIIGIIMNRL